MRFLKLIPAIVMSTFALLSPQAASQAVSPFGECFLQHIGEPGEQLYERLLSIQKHEELLEMRIRMDSVQPTSDEYVSYVRAGLARSSQWALLHSIDNTIKYLLQGTEPPTVADIQNAFERAGIKSSRKIMMDFLRRFPGHLDARVQLLGLLREVAEERTRNVLKLEIKRDMERDLSKRLGNIVSTSILIDTSMVDDKKLEPEQDIAIWGPYAQELHALFVSGDWRLLPFLHQTQGQIPVDACSPIMIQTYRHNLPAVEAYLEEYPTDPSLWHLYGWMLSIAKQSFDRAFLDRIVPPPNTPWPMPEVLNLLIAEERAKGNWNSLAETLMKNWPEHHRSFASLSNGASARVDYYRDLSKGYSDSAWHDSVEPLLESLIKANRIQEAETAVSDIAKYPLYRDMQRRAADLALALGRHDLYTRWLSLQVLAKDKPDANDFEAVIYDNRKAPRLVVINGKTSDVQQIDVLLRQGQINDWSVSRANITSELSEYLLAKEGWQKGETHWALFHDNTMLAHGPGLPTGEALISELEASRVQTPASLLRRFISEHPSHLAAKEMLLEELKRIAEQKVREKLGTAAGTDAAQLSDENDQAIWGEYAVLYAQTFLDFFEQGRPRGFLIRGGMGPWNSNYFMHSQIMKNHAQSYLPRIEACLKRRPTDEFLWGAWIPFFDLSENRLFADLRETLELSPGNHPAGLPPSIQLNSLTSRYKARSNWQGIIGIQEWRWEIIRYKSLDLLPILEWPRYIQPLLEAYLRLGKNSEANELVIICSQSPVWEQIKQSAVDLAKKCENEALAVQWGRL